MAEDFWNDETLPSEHKFSGGRKSKLGPSRKLCMTNITGQAGQRQSQKGEGHPGGPGEGLGRSWCGSEQGEWNAGEGAELREVSEEGRVAMVPSLGACSQGQKHGSWKGQTD